MEPQGQGGLAAQGQDQQMQQLLQKVIQALMQGAKPEDLVKSGVPPEIVQQAIQVIQQHQQQSQGQNPVQDQQQGAGLAGQGAQ